MASCCSAAPGAVRAHDRRGGGDADPRQPDALGLVGLFVGVVPVALGMLFYPALKAGGRGAFDFALALTVGLLLFLLVDTLEEALELAAEAAPGFHAAAMVWLVAAMTAGLLYAVGRRGGRKLGGLGLATSIALGIGLHNLGEGLAIAQPSRPVRRPSAPFWSSASRYSIWRHRHRRTPGRDSTPAADLRGARRHSPACRPSPASGSAATPSRRIEAPGHGGGSRCDLQVVVEVGLLLLRRARSQGSSVATVPATAGLVAGIVVMYATALLVQA